MLHGSLSEPFTGKGLKNAGHGLPSSVFPSQGIFGAAHDMVGQESMGTQHSTNGSH